MTDEKLYYKFTPKRIRFCEEYLIDLNATQAAIRAGYAKSGARTEGARLLANADVQLQVSRLKAIRSEQLRIDAEWVLRRLIEELVADLADLFDDKGQILPAKEWPNIWRQGLILSLDVEELFGRIEGNPKSGGQIKKMQLADRVKLLELVSRHVGSAPKKLDCL